MMTSGGTLSFYALNLFFLPGPDNGNGVSGLGVKRQHERIGPQKGYLIFKTRSNSF